MQSIKYKTDTEITPCLEDGPIAKEAQAVIDAATRLGTTRWASLARVWAVPYLFAGMESVFASGENPITGIQNLLRSLTDFLSVAKTSNLASLGDSSLYEAEEDLSSSENIQAVTGNHYGQLFKSFSSMSFWEEPARLLALRIERNGIDITEIQDKEVLDAGCGGGRYTVAWRLLGAKRAIGVDVSETGVKNAQQRITEAEIDGVSFQQGNVLALPFADNSFDIVFSNGVLHHTVDWNQGVAELVRVLKPGGLGWLYLIENPGGLFWDVIEILRLILKDESRSLARVGLQVLGIPANRIFYMLDHVMVPINIRLTPDEIEQSLESAGAKAIRRLTRGTDFDRIERIYQEDPFANLKYGVGENRHVFSK